MKAFFNNILLLIYIKFNTIMINLAIILFRAENDIIKISQDSDNKYRCEQRKVHRNAFVEMLVSEMKNDVIVQQYYELLKKTDKFMKKSTARQIAVAADKHLRFEEQDLSNSNGIEVKDKYGRRYSHFGFFDDSHKHAGKTLGDVLNLELNERRTKDDKYEIVYIFNNKPIEVGLVNIMDVIIETDNEKVEHEFEVVDVQKKSKTFKFPINVYREDGNIVNKIEELTEFLHVKKIAFDIRQLEFFIPLKFKTENIEDNSKIFEEITNIKSIFVRNEYGELIGFGINNFIKRIIYNNTHEVWKFNGIEMESVNLKL
jgi:hypothetical protein